MTPQAPVETDIVLVGGGHAHVEVIRRFGMTPAPGVRLTLVSTPVDTPYSGMLPGHLAGHYDFDDYTVDLRRLCRFANARLIIDRATGVDRTARLVSLAGRPPVGFDLLSIDIGSTPGPAGIDGAEYAIPVKPVPAFMERWTAVEAVATERKGAAKIVVIGAGAGGVEATMSLQNRLAHRLKRAGAAAETPEFTIVSKTDAILPNHPSAVRRRLTAALKRKRIDLVTGDGARRIEPGQVVTESGRALPCDATILVTPGAAAGWLRETGLDLDDDGFIRVRPTLQSIADERIFAAGDCASFSGPPLPKAGVYAVRQGPVLADNLRALARGGALKPYRPQRNILALISLGEKRAVASRGWFSAEGEWVWRWKDRIDRRWMDRYEDLPAMSPAMSPAAAAVPADDDAASAMRCGGCGAKVPQAILQAVLEKLRADPATQGVLALDSPDDAAEVGLGEKGVLYQSVDQFRAFVDDPFLFGRIAANHGLGDIYAMGGAAQSALVTLTLPFASPAIVERDLEQILRGVLSTLAEAGATLVGGHTAEGAEMSVGLTVNGVIAAGRPLRKAGAREADRLILTKPLGTGVIMAAEMARAAAGRDVEQALMSMTVSNGAAVPVLQQHGATACTDITGFGLGGHLLEILNASDAGAVIDPAALPLLDGAADLLASGHASTLHPANAAAVAPAVDGAPPPILADPQTAGGLLASVPASRASGCLAALETAGYAAAAIIGTIEKSDGGESAQIRIATRT